MRLNVCVRQLIFKEAFIVKVQKVSLLPMKLLLSSPCRHQLSISSSSPSRLAFSSLWSSELTSGTAATTGVVFDVCVCVNPWRANSRLTSPRWTCHTHSNAQGMCFSLLFFFFFCLLNSALRVSTCQDATSHKFNQLNPNLTLHKRWRRSVSWFYWSW